MTLIGLFYKNGKVYYNLAGSLRDMQYNFAILLPSMRTMSPLKTRYVSLPVKNDIAILQYYMSNRGREYVIIYKINNGLKEVFRTTAPSDFAISAVLEKLGVPKDVIREVLEILGPFSPP